MSAHDGIPDWEGSWRSVKTEEERELYLAEAFEEIAEFEHERRHFHDRDAFYADYAYEAKCLALGHRRSTVDGELEPIDDDELSRDGTHLAGWDGSTICGETRWGTACTECEGECDYMATAPDLWTRSGVLASPISSTEEQS